MGQRILVQEITGGSERRIVASFYDGELYHSRDVIPIKIVSELPTPFFLLAIINSWLITWYHHKRNPKAQKGLFPKVLVSDLKNLPIKNIDFSKPEERQSHDQIVKLVDNLLKLNKQLQATKLETQRQQIQRAIDHAEKKIDELVYGLYGLSKKEIEIIEKT